MLSSNEVAARLGLKSRQSVHDWLRKGKIVGWQTARRGYMFPARQLDERNRPIESLGDIVALFEGAYAAWFWLTTPRNALDGEEPLTVLAKGCVIGSSTQPKATCRATSREPGICGERQITAANTVAHVRRGHRGDNGRCRL